MVGATKNAQFQKALRMIENDIWNNMLHGKNKVTSLDCSIKHFLMPYTARAMTLITLLQGFKSKAVCLSSWKQERLSVI